MSLTTTLTQDFAEQFPELSHATVGAEFPDAHFLATNDALADELGISLDNVQDFIGQPGYALGYSGHQFGGFSPVLGDGRAMLLGELDTKGNGKRQDMVDIHLKGSGRTPYSKPQADGKLPLGAALREMLISEFLHTQNIPSTRTLAVIGTGEQLATPRNKSGSPFPPGAIAVRVATHHIRVGTFQHAALRSPELVSRLVNYSLERGGIDPGDNPVTTVYSHVLESQARLIASWMRLGFVHGVLNTDNVSIAGESIDFGPCAFLDRFDPHAVFSSIDRQGRYAYDKQSSITQWNLARFAEALIPTWGEDTDTGVEALSKQLQRYPDLYYHAYTAEMTNALGPNWQEHLQSLDESTDYAAYLHEVSPHNPLLIPRNQPVQEALNAAEDGDLSSFNEIYDALLNPLQATGQVKADLAHARDEAGFTSYCGT